MQFFTGEFVVLCLLIFVVTKLRKSPSTERLLRNLVIYIPPDEKHIENAKKTPDKFYLNCVKIDDEFSKASPYFAESDFLVLLAVLTASLILICSLFYDGFYLTIEQSLSFYMCILVIFLCVQGAYSQAMQSGLRNPDNLMGLFFTLLTFFMASLLLYLDHQLVFDFNFHLSVKLLCLQLTKALHVFWPINVHFDYLFFCLGLAGIFAMSIFPFFKYIFRSTLNYYSARDMPFDVKGVEDRRWASTLILLSPIIIAILWTKPMLKSQIVPFLVSEFTYEMFRLVILIAVVLLKFSNIRIEVQALLNQSKHLIYSILVSPNKENYESSTLQCRALATYAWPLAHQSLCSVLVTTFLIILLISKGNLLSPYPVAIEAESKSPNKAPLVYDEEEFDLKDTPRFPLVTPSRKTIYYNEIRDLELALETMSENRTDFRHIFNHEKDFVQKLLNMNKQGFVPWVFYRDLFGFVIWWQAVTWSIATIMSLLYTQRFTNKNQEKIDIKKIK